METSFNQPNVQAGFEISDSNAIVANPKVSVILLAYNHGLYLSQAIESVLSQQINISFELLISEDFSTDNSREVAEHYQRENPGKIRLLLDDRNVGPAQNHRRAILAARGEYHAYLDGDDYWLPGKLAVQIDFLESNPDCVAVFTNAYTVDRLGRKTGLFNDVGDNKFSLSTLLRRGNFLHNSSMVYRGASRNALLGSLEPTIDYGGHLQLARIGLLAHLSAPMTAYRVNSVGSLLADSNDNVRRLYWDAITNIPREELTDNDLAYGISDFMRRVIFRTLRTQRPGLLWTWAPRVFAISPYGKVRTSLLIAASVVRSAFKEFAGVYRKNSKGAGHKVLYRR